MKPPKLLQYATRQAWRQWLLQHHSTVSEIWLVYFKKHTGKPSVAYNDAVEEAICFGWIDGLIRRLDDERYMQRYTPRTRNSRWSALNIRRAKAMIRQRLMTEAGMAAFKTGKPLPSGKVRLKLTDNVSKYSDDIQARIL